MVGNEDVDNLPNLPIDDGMDVNWVARAKYLATAFNKNGRSL